MDHLVSVDQRRPDLSIYLSSLNGVDSASRFALACLSIDAYPVVCVEPHVATGAKEVLEPRGIEVRALPPLGGWARRPFALLRDFGSSLNMGDNPANTSTNLPRSAWKATVVRRVRLLPGKPSARTVNRWLRRLFGRRFPVSFPSRHVLVISFPLVPERLCHPDLLVDTVVDSWDHPVRRTAGYVSRLAIAWNDDLGADWERYQGAEGTLIGPPVKLEYALGATASTAEQTRVLLYPVATSPHYPTWFADELALIDAIARAADQAGWQVLVKPKPESTPEELEAVARHPNVVLGRFHKSFGALDYHLDPDYNCDRLAEVRQADVVVNALTTFGLDAASASAPLIQIDLTACSSLPTLAGVAANHHLQAHLYRIAAPGSIRPTSLAELEATLAGRLQAEPSAASIEASAHLRAWASPGVDADLHAVMARVLAG